MDKQIQEEILSMGESAFRLMVERQVVSSIVFAIIGAAFIVLCIWGMKKAYIKFKDKDTYDKSDPAICGIILGFMLLLAMGMFVSNIISAIYPEATVLENVLTDKTK